MPSKLKYEVTASVGKYTKDGEEKTRYLRCGSVFENEKGHLSVKLDCVPVGQEWSGWFSLFEPREQGQDRTPQDAYRKREPYQARDNGGGDGPDDSDEIPFTSLKLPWP